MRIKWEYSENTVYSFVPNENTLGLQGEYIGYIVRIQWEYNKNRVGTQ